MRQWPIELDAMMRMYPILFSPHDRLRMTNHSRKRTCANTKTNRTRRKTVVQPPVGAKPLLIGSSIYDPKSLAREIRKTNASLANKKQVTPQEDYYTYINNDWLKSEMAELKNVPEYYVEADDFRIVQDAVYREVIELATKYCKTNSSQKSTNLSNLMKSSAAMDTIAHRNNLMGHVDEIRSSINKLTGGAGDEASMYKMLGFISESVNISFGSPIVWSVMPDSKNVKKMISCISPPQLSINDYMVYIDDPGSPPAELKSKSETKRKFHDYINRMFKAVDADWKGSGEGSSVASDVWDVEVELLDAIGCTNRGLKDDPEYYNNLSIREIKENTGLDWGMFSKVLGYSTTPPRAVLTSQNAIKCIFKLVCDNWTSLKWQTYWRYICWRQVIRFDSKWRKSIHFDFHEKFIKGQDIPMPDSIYAIFPMSFCFNTLLTELYVAKNKVNEETEYVKNMANDLRRIFIGKIKRNTWLSESTRKMAIKKLEMLEMVVGKPKKLEPDPNITYSPNDILGNIMKLSRWKCRQSIRMEGKPQYDTPDIDWKEFKLVGTQAYTVNAYYRPNSNSIYIPQAYLQAPFIDLKDRGIEYNLAYIGYTMGHEFSHALDDMGSKFDEYGNMRNWWTSQDRAKFNRKISDVVNQYEEVAQKDGIVFDAKNGVGEDLADISGMALVEEYLYHFLENNKVIPVVRLLSFKALYIYSAIQSRQHINKSSMIAELKNNPHPPEKYRCNCPLSRLSVFREIYGITPKDKMWWRNTDTIW